MSKQVSGMKSWPGLIMVLVVCLMAIALPAAPAQAQGAARIRLFPNRGVPGQGVTVQGFNFDPGQVVGIYYDGERVTDESTGTGNFTAIFFVPESSRGPHTVHGEVMGTAIYPEAIFTVKPGLSMSPETGPVGTNVTVEGRGFGSMEGGIRIYFSGELIEIEEDIKADVYGSWTESFQIPASLRGSHRIDAEGDESRLYEVKDDIFEVTPGISIAKPSGTVGQSIMMTGTAFATLERHISILFAGQALVTGIPADDTGYWEESFNVPEMPGGTYVVTAEGDWTKKGDLDGLSFEIGPDIVLSPPAGHVGLNLTVIGRGFAPNEDVVILYDDSEAARDTTDDKGSFEEIFRVPESQHGERQVTAAAASGNNATATFTMESDLPPLADLISPADRDRVGFVGTIRPRFEWSEVEDPSGVYYRLQVSASANVTADGDFVNPVVFREGLVGGNYTLDNTEGLPYGTYYWIVQAVDGADNAGNWTTARSFRAGLLPLGGFIAIIVFAALLIGGLVYFFVVRRRRYF